MSSKPQKTIAPVGTVVSLDEVKAQLSISWPDHDALLGGYIAAAEAHLDGPAGILGRFMLTQTWEVKFDCFGVGLMRLPFVDVQSVTVTYQDADDVTQTVSDAIYTLADDDLSSAVVFYSGFQAPTLADVPFPITVSMVVGYGAAAEVPAAIKAAIQMMVAQWFEGREGLSDAAGEIPNGVSTLVEPYRVNTG